MVEQNVAPPKESEKLRLDTIDGLRAIAALWVLSYHMWVRFLPGLTANHLDQGWWMAPLGWCRYGRFAVDFFIVISGFCLMLPVIRAGHTLRGGVMHFWKKRARRILPTYYAAILVTLPLCWLFVDWSRWYVTLKGLALHLVLLQDIYNNNEISSVYWSIAVECHIYLLFPLLVLLSRKIGAWGTFLAGSATGFALYCALKGTPYIGSTPQYLILFSLGMLSASLCMRSRKKALWGTPAAPLCIAVLALCGSTGIERMEAVLENWSALVLDCLVGLCAACVIIAAAQSRGMIARLLSLKPLVLIGGFSYSLYLVHAPIHFICYKTLWVLMQQHHVPADIAYPLFIVVSVPIVLTGALVFHLFFEAPLLTAGSGGALEEITGRLRAHSPLLQGLERLSTRWLKRTTPSPA